MNSLNLIIALTAFLALAWATQSLATEYWVVTDDAGMPTVTDKKPTHMMAGFGGPFKYYDQAVRAMGTGTEWRSRCYITGLCTNAKDLGH
jgi:hypothetical protein